MPQGQKVSLGTSHACWMDQHVQEVVEAYVTRRDLAAVVLTREMRVFVLFAVMRGEKRHRFHR